MIKNRQIDSDIHNLPLLLNSNQTNFSYIVVGHAIINQPQIAILSVDGIHKRPVVISAAAGDEIAVRPVGILAQSFDHSAIDGAYSAAFLNRVKSILEKTNWEQELETG